jgi:hypothetical protein
MVMRYLREEMMDNMGANVMMDVVYPSIIPIKCC